MGKYAKIEDGKIKNIIIIEDSQVQNFGGNLVNVTEYAEQPGIGWSFDNGSFIAPVVPQKEMKDIVKNKIIAAKNAANLISEEFAVENVMLGITQAGKTKLIADALSSVFYYASTGSLYEAINALDAVVVTEGMWPFLTEEKKAAFRLKFVNAINSL
jgi:hypothetical protein